MEIKEINERLKKVTELISPTDDKMFDVIVELEQIISDLERCSSKYSTFDDLLILREKEVTN